MRENVASCEKIVRWVRSIGLGLGVKVLMAEMVLGGLCDYEKMVWGF
jgi:hypothetical protein